MFNKKKETKLSVVVTQHTITGVEKPTERTYRIAKAEEDGTCIKYAGVSWQVGEKGGINITQDEAISVYEQLAELFPLEVHLKIVGRAFDKENQKVPKQDNGTKEWSW